MSHCHRCPKKCNHFRSLELSSHYCQLYWLDAVHLQCAGHPKNMFLTWHHLRLSLMITLTTAWAWRCDGDYAAEHLMVRVCLSPSHCQPPTPPPPPPPPPPAPSLSPPVLCWPVRAWPPPFLIFLLNLPHSVMISPSPIICPNCPIYGYGPILLIPRGFADFTDVTLAAEDNNSMRATPPGEIFETDRVGWKHCQRYNGPRLLSLKPELSLQLKWIQIQFRRKDNSSYRLNTLGLLCLWQCFSWFKPPTPKPQTIVFLSWLKIGLCSLIMVEFWRRNCMMLQDSPRQESRAACGLSFQLCTVQENWQESLLWTVQPNQLRQGWLSCAGGDLL